MEKIDLKLIHKTHRTSIVGIDEVGRGPLAGPVVACAFRITFEKDCRSEEIFDYFKSLGIDDSKKLNENKRRKIIDELLLIDPSDLPKHQIWTRRLNKFVLFDFSIAEISPFEIDRVNILNATLKAMEIAYAGLPINREDQILVDGNRVPKGFGDQAKAIVKGDSHSWAIALASIVAKEYRDQIMSNLAQLYPEYGFDLHAGYGTRKHLEAIENFGVTKIHRTTFKGVKEHLLDS